MDPFILSLFGSARSRLLVMVVFINSRKDHIVDITDMVYQTPCYTLVILNVTVTNMLLTPNLLITL